MACIFPSGVRQVSPDLWRRTLPGGDFACEAYRHCHGKSRGAGKQCKLQGHAKDLAVNNGGSQVHMRRYATCWPQILANHSKKIFPGGSLRCATLGNRIDLLTQSGDIKGHESKRGKGGKEIAIQAPQPSRNATGQMQS